MSQSLLINCQSISKSFGAQNLFDGLNVSFHQNDRVGLIGPNGSGKSTLLRVLSGIEHPDDGEISVRKETSTGYLSQQDTLDPGSGVEDVLLRALSSTRLTDTEKYSRVNKWLAQLNVTSPDQQVSSLSGGLRKRLSIMSALVTEPDLLFLDEPTNHLDIDGILWLEDILRGAAFGFVVVSHDRYFLENVTTRVIEINKVFPNGFLEVEGNFSEYIFRREAAINEQLQLEAVLANKARRENEWLNRGPKARTSKARYRIEEAYRLKDELVSVRSRNRETSGIKVEFESTDRKTKKLLTAKNISKSIDGRGLFSDISFILTPGTRLGIAGNNGTGKSTLIKTLIGEESPDAGTIRTAENVKIELFEQDRDSLNPSESLRSALSPAGDSVVYRGRSVHVISWAKRFQFRSDQLDLPVSQLSGGEQARILLARFMLRPADILMLDEPTNDLDIPSLDMLEESLRDFPGAIVLVTHDRFLMDRLATNVIGLNGDGTSGVFSDSEQWTAAVRSKKKQTVATKSSTRSKSKGKKLSYKDQRELNLMEEKIEEAELALEEAQTMTESAEVVNEPAALAKWCAELDLRQTKVDELYQRWEELEQKKAEC